MSGPGEPGWSAHLTAMAEAEATGRRAELRRLSAATRRLLHGMIMTDVDDATIAETADALEALAAPFQHPSGRSMHESFGEASVGGGSTGFFEHSPILGESNPIAPPIVLRGVDDRTMEGLVTFGPAYEGPPGHVHGGFVAAGFDEVLGAVQSLSGQPGMTGTLTVRYRSPSPLHEPLRYTARWDRVEGRKIFTSGTLHAGDVLCAEGEAIFVSIDFSRLAELREQRAEQEARRTTGG